MYNEIVFDMSEDMDHTVPHKVTDKWYEDSSDIATIELDDDYTVSAECISNTPYVKEQ